MEFWTFLWGCNTSIPMNCHVQLCGPFPTQSLHHCSSLLVCNVVCHHMSQGFHIMGSVMLQVCCVTSQGLSCHRFVVSHHRVCHAPGLLRHITGSVTGSVMLQVCCVTSQGLSRHSFVVTSQSMLKARWEYAVQVTKCKRCHLPFTAEGRCITFMLLCWTKLQGNEKWMHV